MRSLWTTAALLAGMAGAASPMTLALLPASIHRPGPPPRQEPGDTTQSPYFWVKGDESVEALPLKSTSVKAAIAGVIADVKVVQVYRNTGQKPIEAVYVFPGSTRAAVHGLKMTIGERTIEAQIQERGQARATYEAAKQEGRTASLLEQQRPNVFQMNVANILPGDEVKVELDYTELLRPEDGTYSFVYPTVVGPRYAGIPGTASSTGEAWVANPYTRAGEAPTSTLDLEVKLDAGMPIQRMSCVTHKTSIAYDGADNATVKLDPGESKGGNRDFILDYQLSGAKVQSGLLLFKGKDENFFLLMAQPPKRVAPADMPPREYIFIMDVSGSQMGFPIEVSKALMKEMIQGLRPQDLFNVMVFEGSSALWAPQSRHATSENLQSALDFVRQQNGGGGTELRAALQRALDLPRVPGISRTFTLSTDGYISADASVFDTIRQHLGDANLFAFGIGSSVNRHLIEGMAHAGQGEPFVVTKQEEAHADAERFRAYVSSPALSQVRLRADGFEIYDLEPKALPDVLAERPVLCFGKWRGEAKGTVSISGRTGHGDWNQVFHVGDVKPADSNAALRQLWARERIRTLSDYDQFGETPERAKEVTQLGLRYHLLTAHTSFVAVDSEVRNAGGESARIVQPLPMPQGVSDAAVGGSYAATPSSMAYLAPGAGMAKRAAKVETMGQMAEVDQVAEAPAPPPSATPGLRLLQLQSATPGLKVEALRPALEARLMDPALVSLMTGLPKGTVMTLAVDAQGRVTGVHFDQAFPGEAKAIARIRAWTFRAWTGQTALLRATLEMR
ncbi:MAG TPA: VIT domain-containing protein [Holophagaceae bacterium]|nr:VIT domain-containing protein [Holophagaceae bacterium]